VRVGLQRLAQSVYTFATMPFASHTVRVDAPAELVWSLLLEKIEHPERFIPGARDVKIVRRFAEHAVERVMCIGPVDRPREVREVISYDVATRTVIFKLLGDAMHVGFVTNTVFEDDDGVRLNFSLCWTPRSGDDDTTPETAAMIRRAVEMTRDVCEAAARVDA
jgi:carbon monoxide dehydrogenase subunit G